MPTREQIGRLGVWFFTEVMPAAQAGEFAARLESLGYTTLWMPEATGRNPLVGKNDDRLGPRFPDMSNAYDSGLREAAKAVAGEMGLAVQEGVYVGLLGPSYETPAEIRMLRTLGANAVGMSTVLEVIAAHHIVSGMLVKTSGCASRSTKYMMLDITTSTNPMQTAVTVSSSRLLSITRPSVFSDRE